jgi:hypothetical protein
MPRCKGKGSEFERKIAKEIIKFFRKHVQKDLNQNDCWRSVLSGGHEMSSGDLRMSSRMLNLFPFSIECKHRKKIRFENFFLEKRTEERRWLRQAINGSIKIKNMTPVIVMRANANPIYAFVGPLSEVHDTGAEVYFPDVAGPWKLMPWRKFLKLAILNAKQSQRKPFRI